jgi:hypothetical protein
VGQGVGGTLSVRVFFEGLFLLRLERFANSRRSIRMVCLVTGCIDPSALDRINPGDEGGQYDSSGGSEGTGNPVGSVCEG